MMWSLVRKRLISSYRSSRCYRVDGGEVCAHEGGALQVGYNLATHHVWGM